MQWPWVSRETVADAWRARALAAEARVDWLLAKLVERETPPKRELPAREIDPLQDVIRGRAGNNGVVRRALGQYVKEARAQGVEEDIILRQITDWPTSDDEGVDG